MHKFDFYTTVFRTSDMESLKQFCEKYGIELRITHQTKSLVSLMTRNGEATSLWIDGTGPKLGFLNYLHEDSKVVIAATIQYRDSKTKEYHKTYEIYGKKGIMKRYRSKIIPGVHEVIPDDEIVSA